MSKARVLVAGTWDDGAGYPRTRALVAGLRAHGVETVEERVPLPSLGAAKSRFLRSPAAWPRFALALRRVKHELVARVARRCVAEPFDAVLVPYPGHLAAPWLRRVVEAPLVLDLFLSAHGTAVVDRALFAPGSLAARALRWVDRRACAAADLVLLDTPQHVALVGASTGLPADHFDWVPIADPDAAPVALPARTRAHGEPLRVLFFGTGVALHGLRTLIDAVAACAGVHLTLVGGTDGERAHARAAIEPARLELGGAFEETARLQQRLAACDVVAGVFGTSAKAAAVVPFKVVHGLAAGRPVLTGDTPAVRALLAPGVDCLVAPTGDAVTLAERLRACARDPAALDAVARAGRRAYEARFSVQAAGRALCAALERAAERARVGVGVAVT